MGEIEETGTPRTIVTCSQTSFAWAHGPAYTDQSRRGIDLLFGARELPVARICIAPSLVTVEALPALLQRCK
jgi:hypothetical protein